jgi:beta-phosphoglucomutase
MHPEETMQPRYAVIWDVDGTLVDTAELHYRAWDRMTRELDLPFTRDDFNATFGWRNAEIIRKLFEPQSSDERVSELGLRKEEYYRAAARQQGISLLPGARPLLEGLHARGVAQAIGSSAPHANIELILQLTQTQAFFEAISSMEDTQRGKPDPQVFQLAADKLGVPYGHCLVLEDAVVGVEAARRGGMKCVAVRFVGHHPKSALRQAGANRVVDSLEELTPKAVLDGLQKGT